MTSGIRRIVALLPTPLADVARRVARWARAHRRVRMGRLRRLTPLVENWGLDRGQPVDRHFIESYIQRHRHVIRGVVMEVQYPEYTEKFGESVTRSEIVDIDTTNDRATRYADLGELNSLPAATYDCAIVTQTLQFVESIDTAIANLWQSIKPGGTMIVTMPTVSKLEPSLAATESWRLTPHGLELILARQCPGGAVDVSGYGNILVSVSFLHGLVTSDLRSHELDHYDPVFPTGACGRVTKPAMA